MTCTVASFVNGTEGSPAVGQVARGAVAVQYVRTAEGFRGPRAAMGGRDGTWAGGDLAQPSFTIYPCSPAPR